MTKILINEQYDVEEVEATKGFAKGEKRADYADSWKETGNVILLGLAGSGKGVLGASLSERTGLFVVTPSNVDEAVTALTGESQIIVLSDELVEDAKVNTLIHGAGKAFYLMADSNTLSERVAVRDGVKDREELWRAMSERLALMEPTFYSVLHFILQAAQTPEEMVEDALEKIAF